MLVYRIVFGTDFGQVNCVFHDDANASSGIGPNGEFNCFTCGAKAHDDAGFIAKYFEVGYDRACKIRTRLNNVQRYNYTKNQVTTDQRKYLQSIGLVDSVIDKYFFNSAVGKLIYHHTWRGFSVGHTWFNAPELPAYNAGATKYRYDKNVIGGMLSPYDDVMRYNSLVICEGEKDMLTAKSMGIASAVAKIGGAQTYMIGGKNLYNKNIIIVYDCDEWGREYAARDAMILQDRWNCNVKVIDLKLQDKEDLNDYFVKYNHTKQDFYDLIKATPEFVAPPELRMSKVEKLYASLTIEEKTELKIIIEKETQHETKS